MLPHRMHPLFLLIDSFRELGETPLAGDWPLTKHIHSKTPCKGRSTVGSFANSLTAFLPNLHFPLRVVSGMWWSIIVFVP